MEARAGLSLATKQSEILLMVIQQGLELALIGIGIGLAGSLALTRYLESQRHGVSPSDPLTFASVSLLLLFVSLVASAVPARRAAKMDPMVALRYE